MLSGVGARGRPVLPRNAQRHRPAFQHTTDEEINGEQRRGERGQIRQKDECEIRVEPDALRRRKEGGDVGIPTSPRITSYRLYVSGVATGLRNFGVPDRLESTGARMVVI